MIMWFARLIVILFVANALPASAQHLLFYNIELQKSIRVLPGQTLAVSYVGYNGVVEYAKLTVTDITDSTVVLGVNPKKLPLFNNMKDGKHINTYKVVSLKDIQAFRRITVKRQLLKTTMRAALIAGTYLLIVDVTQNGNMNAGEIFMLSLGVGIAGNVAINTLLPDKVKYQMADGWQVKYIP
jgi:predicted secreted protein